MWSGSPPATIKQQHNFMTVLLRASTSTSTFKASHSFLISIVQIVFRLSLPPDPKPPSNMRPLIKSTVKRNANPSKHIVPGDKQPGVSFLNAFNLSVKLPPTMSSFQFVKEGGLSAESSQLKKSLAIIR
jgi:hypothetical protein